jgi:hypothetical protein
LAYRPSFYFLYNLQGLINYSKVISLYLSVFPGQHSTIHYGLGPHPLSIAMYATSCHGGQGGGVLCQTGYTPRAACNLFLVPIITISAIDSRVEPKGVLIVWPVSIIRASVRTIVGGPCVRLYG